MTDRQPRGPLPIREAVAHLCEDGRPHLLLDHLTAVADRAAEFAASFGGSEWARFAGALHDLGKFSPGFQNRIREENGFDAHLEEAGKRQKDHSTAGLCHAIGTFGPAALPAAFAIAGHHGGLPDAARLKERLATGGRLLDDALGQNPPVGVLAARPPTAPPIVGDTGGQKALHVDLWTRLLFSALCDADFLDTEAFYDPASAAIRSHHPSLDQLALRLDDHLSRLETVALRTDVNRVRAEIRRACLEAAALAPGAFSLTVPTGGGKTLAGMSFALAHAVRHGLARVIVAIPYTSIIEQTAEVYRAAFGGDAVLEHHSSLDPARETRENRLAAENWDAPIIVTTTAQLFDSLFAARPGPCRKLHRIARSVIILDEAQTLPPGLLLPILDVLGNLTRHFGASLVVSTATQPALGREHVDGGLDGVREIVPREVAAFDRLRRVRTRWPSSREVVPYEELAREISAERDVLAIVHRRKDARLLCEQIDGLLGSCDTVHLSALLCPEHRSSVLAEVRARKGRGQAVRMVSTQVVEAGVDLDFPVVYRALAGLDAMAQAAGRCNREGRLSVPGELRVFRAPTSPPRGVPATAAALADGMLAANSELDLFSSATFVEYFRRLYGARNLDSKGIQEARQKLMFATVADQFELIEDGWSAPVLVPYGGARDLLEALRTRGPSRALLRSLGRLMVNVPRVELGRWLASGSAHVEAGIVAVLDDTSAYDNRFGLVLERVGCPAPTALIVE